MANEVQIRDSMQVNADNVVFPFSGAFTATMTGRKGPVPGSVTVTTEGVDVDLSGLSIPGLCWLKNQHTSRRITYGIYDPEFDRYYPLGELLAGETTRLRLAQELFQEFQSGIGTGTGGSTNTLRFVSFGGDVNVFVGAFEV